MVDGPTWVVPMLPVPPDGVPWPLLGAVVLLVPPAGPTVACAKAGPAARHMVSAARETALVNKRIQISDYPGT